MSALESQLRRSVFHVQQQKAKRLQMTNAIQLSEAAPIVVHRDVSGPLEFTPTQQQMIRDTYAMGASEKEFQVLMEVAKVRRLNPLLRQVHFVKRRDYQRDKDIWSVQVSVDGLRAIAERTGKYDGQDEPEFERDKDGLIIACRVRVYRKDWSRPAVGVAYWSEYVQTKKDGSPTKFWADMPHVMIAKCAEAIAMRKAFPEDMGGLYVDEEMQQAENGPQQLPSGNGSAGALSPHVGPDEDTEEGPFDAKLASELEDILLGVKEAVKTCDSYERMLELRAIIGTKAKQSDLTKRIQAGTESRVLSVGMRSELGKLWQHCHRQLTALEGKLKPPPVEASFTDEPDGTEPFAGRDPGDDAEEDVL